MTLAYSSASTSWIGSLADAGVRSDVSSLAADGTLTYADLLKILQDVSAKGAVTAAQFSSLQAIAANLNNGVQTSDYLASIFMQLVNGSPANATWTGGGTTALALGNLAAGTSAAQLNQLIGKWFLGTDLPSSGTGAALTYKAFTAPLYGPTGSPQITDIAQGQVGDCAVMSGLAEVVLNNPASIKSMIVDNGNGTYGVRFFVNGNEMWVTVNNQLPAYGSAGYLYDGVWNAPDIWSSLVEKAYVQLSATGLISHPAVNSYANIDGDYPGVVASNYTGASQAVYYRYTDANWANDAEVVLQALASGENVTMESWVTTYTASGSLMLVGAHAYAVLGWDAVTSAFMLFNPWGVQLEATIANIVAAQGDFVITNSARGSITVSGANATWPAQNFVAATPVAVSKLFSVTDTTGAPITQYKFEIAGTSVLNLNGATNLASPAQAAKGQVVVAASDLGKVTVSGGTTGVTETLMVWASDGATWSPVTDITLNPGAATSAVVVRPGAWMAAGSTVSLGSLFTVIGATSSSGSYQITTVSGGTVNLNGSTLWAGSAATGQYDFYASSLQNITYTAMSGAATASFYVWYYNGSAWTAQEQVTINVEAVANVAAAISDYDAGQFAAAGVISDTSANIFANLDALQTIVSNGTVAQIVVTDAGAVTKTLTYKQFAADMGALAIMSGSVALVVSGATAAQALGLKTAVALPISLLVSDTAANIAANIDALAADSAVAQVTFTDAAPVLSITSAQYAADGALLARIRTAYTLNIYSAPGVLQSSTDYNAAGGLADHRLYNADGTYDIVVSAQGQAWTTDDTLYAANGTRLHEIFSNAQGALLERIWNADGTTNVITSQIAGQPYTSLNTHYAANGNTLDFAQNNASGVYFTETFNADGTVDEHSWQITGQSYTDYDVVYAANGKVLRASWSNGEAIAWTWNADGSYEIVDSNAPGKPYTVDTRYSATGAPVDQKLITTQGLVEEKIWNASGLLSDKTWNADGTTNVINAQIAGQPYTSLNTHYAANGTTLGFVQSNAAGLYFAETFNADGSVDEHSWQVTGQPYTDYDVLYSASGKVMRASWSNGETMAWTYNANGTYEIVDTNAPGQSFTIDTLYSAAGAPLDQKLSAGHGVVSEKTWNPDGSTNVVTLQVSGQPYTSMNVHHAANGAVLDFTETNAQGLYYAQTNNADGSYDEHFYQIASQPWTDYDALYGANNRLLGVTWSNGQTQTLAYKADGAWLTTVAHVAGANYASYESAFAAGGAWIADAVDYFAGIGRLTLGRSGLTVTSSSGSETVTSGADSFVLAAHPAGETINAAGTTNDVFAFHAGAGAITINGFAPSDYLQFDKTQFADLSKLTIQQSGGNTLIAEGGGDQITLIGVASVNAAQFRFV